MDKEQEVNGKIIELIEDRVGIQLKNSDDGEKQLSERELQNDLGLDSLDIVEVVIDLENHFKIVIPDQELEDIKTVNDVFKLVNSKLL